MLLAPVLKPVGCFQNINSCKILAGHVKTADLGSKIVKAINNGFVTKNNCRVTLTIMRIHTFIFALAFTFICGCASERYVTGHGDAGKFILQKVEAVGAIPVATNGLPRISGHWRYTVADVGRSVTIYLPLEAYPVVQGFLLQALGSPKLGPTVADDGKSGGGVYRLTPQGGGLLFRHDDKNTIVFIMSLASQRKLSD